MDIRIINEAGEEVASIEELKLHLRIEHTEEDAYLSYLIRVATEYCENYTGREIRSKTLEILLDAFPNGILTIQVYPLKSINQITYKDINAQNIILDPADYIAVTDTEPSVIIPKTQWPQEILILAGAVRVEVMTGYEIVPQSIKHAVLMLCGHFYENREAVGTGRIDDSEMPYSVKALLNPYRVIRW